MKIEDRIVLYLTTIYSLSNEHEQKIWDSLQPMGEEDKKKTLLAVYSRYLDYINNTNTFKRNIDIVGNSIKELKEKQGLDNLLKDII